MGEAKSHSPVLLLMAVFSRHDQALQWTREQAEQHWGPLAFSSEVFTFDDTTYYERSMGANLKKTFFVFENRFNPERLPEVKLQTNQWEELYRDQNDWPRN